MYNRFHLEGLSTEHGRRSNPLHAGSPADTEAGGGIVHQSPPVALLDETTPKTGRSILIEDSVQMVASEPSDTDNTSTLSQDFGHDRIYGSKVRLPVPGVVGESLAATGSLDRTGSTESEIMENAIIGMSADLGTSVSTHHSPDQLTSEEREIGRSHRYKKQNILSPAENDQIIQRLTEAGFLSNAQHGGGRTRHPYRIKEAGTPSHSRSKTPIGKICSFFDKNGSESKARAKQHSPFPDNDSGYHSGRGTPSTLHLRDSLISRPESLTEFRGLYRVACHTLHEPKHPDQYRGVQSCHFCGYSSIQNLAWSANHLKLQEFEVELRSKGLYDLQALDAAGNSALHYAAISGASCDHLKALINAGVPLYVRNTANQNFLHCLRPCDADTESYSLDCFKLGLVELLEMVEPKNAFGQQDNDGQTVLHVLASHIIEPELREQTFK